MPTTTESSSILTLCCWVYSRSSNPTRRCSSARTARMACGARSMAELAYAAGRERIPITVFTWSIDEKNLERCAAAGVDRCVMALAPKDEQTVDEFLQQCEPLVARYAVT
jgi:hypothetical protein